MKRFAATTVLLLLCISISTLAFRTARGEDTESPAYVPIKTGQVVAHLVGRLLIDGRGSGQLVGYFPYIAGLDGSFFSGAPSEATAFFTLRSSSFGVDLLSNGNILHLFAVPPNGISNLAELYFNESANRNFDDPDSFSSGRLIAKFQSERSMATYFGTGASQLGTIDLLSSSNFKFHGQVYNFGNLKSATVELSFPGAPLSGSLPSGPAVVPFGGSLLAVGPTGIPGHEEDSSR